MDIKIMENGPAIITCKHTITLDGEDTGKSTVALCRCGKSENGKTCDGSHAK